MSKFYNHIADLALDVIIENPAVDAWVFTNQELEKFAQSLVEEAAEVAWCNFHADGSAIHSLIKEWFDLYDLPEPQIDHQDLIYRLRKRAEIRRQIPTRKSVQEGKPDRIADLLEDAAREIERLRKHENT